MDEASDFLKFGEGWEVSEYLMEIQIFVPSVIPYLPMLCNKQRKTKGTYIFPQITLKMATRLKESPIAFLLKEQMEVCEVYKWENTYLLWH